MCSFNGTFYQCANFNQPLENWKVSNVTDMHWMFRGCTNFNQPLDNWDVSKVANMKNMFMNCSSLKKLPKWYDQNKLG
ncbi:DUF285 domain-containing protein [Helicobacter bizzozeronii]|uniref:DUF285 domain-containing protein n=1 Tax=Helicobacter bizzozeronii TaxID=56877 RepID=UPI001F34774C|nr:DUF285 domain-containing protein [Helicobacter bizzozeronii]